MMTVLPHAPAGQDTDRERRTIIFTRLVVYLLALAIALACYGYQNLTEPSDAVRALRLTEWFGYLAALALYCALLISPLHRALPALPGRQRSFAARRAVGVSAFAFACLHAQTGFIDLLGGWHGLGFLGSLAWTDLLLSCVALLILGTLALTSNSRAQSLLGKRWYRLHRLVYLAAALVLLHMALVGSHFFRWNLLTLIATVMLSILLLLELLRSLRYRKKKHD